MVPKKPVRRLVSSFVVGVLRTAAYVGTLLCPSLFRNCITELCVPLSLPELKLLDVSKNNVEKVSPAFLTGCPKLETLSISMNKICECGAFELWPKSRSRWTDVGIFVPPGSLLHLSSKITTLKLANNSFTEVSQAILCLPK